MRLSIDRLVIWDCEGHYDSILLVDPDFIAKVRGLIDDMIARGPVPDRRAEP